MSRNYWLDRRIEAKDEILLKKIFKIYWSTDDIKNLKTMRLTCYHIRLTEFRLRKCF